MKKSLEVQIREALRFRHHSIRTEETYVGWYKRFVKFHRMRHPAEMGEKEVEEFLTFLAAERNVVAATQNQALNALVFLYREVLKKELEKLDAMRARPSRKLPVVLSVEETRRLLESTDGEDGLVVRLLYGCGLRVCGASRSCWGIRI